MFKILPRYDLNLSGATDQATTAQNTGNNAINSFDPTAAGQKVMNSTGDLATSLGKQTGQYVSDYTKAVQANPTVTALYNAGNTMFNVPQLAQTATNLQNRLTDVVPNAFQGAKGFDIDSTDINNGIANASAYLTPQAGRATANYNTAAGLASNFVQAGQAQNAQNLLPIQAQAPLLQQSEGAQGTVWNTAAQQTLQGLIAKMQAGVQLSTNEMEMAKTLAQAEEAYQQQQTQNQTTLANTIQGQKYIPVAAGNNLVNTVAQSFVNPSTGRVGGY